MHAGKESEKSKAVLNNGINTNTVSQKTDKSPEVLV